MSNKILIYLALTGIFAVSVGGTISEEPSFVEPIPNITIAAGRDIRLSCVVDNLGSYKVAWIAFDKSAILTVQDHVITRNPRVKVTHDGQRTWTLHISRVNSTDAGTYMCQVNTIIAKSQFGVLTVVVPPNIIDSDTSGDVMAQEGANINLTCNASGTPQPSITWRREDNIKININKTLQVAEHNGVHLHLERISRMDMAAYLCIASNGVPPIVSKRIQVSVEFPPMMSIPHQLVGAPLGYSITMECTIEAHPPPLTYWTLGQSAMLHQGRKYHITNTIGEVPYRTHMKLTVKSLRPEDYGSYKCVAKNSRGDTEGLIKLYETHPPTTPPTSPPSYLDKLFQDFNFKTTNMAATNGDEDTAPGGHSEETMDRQHKEEEENQNVLRIEKGSREEKHIQDSRSQNGDSGYDAEAETNEEQEHRFIRFLSHGLTVHQTNSVPILRCLSIAAVVYLQYPL
ncbi:lachesin-like [Macrobrachium rosenbergii]|uniref:lachesin-like n=1 Tax=Macrobrachium rosenbergii TaxID=79674 RepID=UPI0034D4C18D